MKKETKEFWKYISFSILGMLGSAGTILADTFFVSNRLGAEGLAALNLAITVFGLLNGTGMMFGLGGAARYVILKAGGKEREADQAFSMALFAAVIVGALLWMAGTFFSEDIARMLGANYEIWPMCTRYLRTVLSFSPFFILNHFFMAFIRNDGNPRLAMFVMITGSFANVILDYLFMYPLGMGMFGAALATGLAPVIGLAVASWHLWSKRNGFHLVPVKVSILELRKTAEAGISAFVNEVSAGMVLAVFNLLILHCAGNTGVAAYGIVANLALVVLAVFTGITQGIQPLISHAYGKGEKGEAEKLYRKGKRLDFVIGLFVILLSYAAAEELVLLFNSSGEAVLQELAEEGLRLYFTGFLFAGANYLTASYFCIIQKSVAAVVLSFFRGCIGIIGIAIVFAAVFEMRGIWIAFPVTELGTMFIGRILGERRGLRDIRNIWNIQKTSF